jgi:hypothetical protein
MSENFELKLFPEETLSIVKKLTNFYEDIVTIQDYFLKRKKEKIENIDHNLYKDLLFLFLE